MQRGAPGTLGTILLSLVIGLLLPVTVASTPAAAAPTPKGTLVLKIRTPDGIPGTVKLRSGRKTRVATKQPAGTVATVKLRLPKGRWVVSPQQLVVDPAVYVGQASKRRVAIRPGARTRVTVIYRQAPSVTDLQVTRITPNGLDLSWTAPPGDAEYAVRMATGHAAPASAEAGTRVAPNGTTATASDLTEGATYSFSVFSREPGTTRWWGPVPTTVTMPSTPAPGAVSATIVTNPAAVVVRRPGDVTASVTPDGVVSTVPPGIVPVPGQPWVLPRKPSSLPGGFVGWVKSVSADGSSVLLKAGGLADAYDYLDISVPDLSTGPLRIAHRPSHARSRLTGTCGGSGAERFEIDPVFDPFGDFDVQLRKYEVLGSELPLGVSFDGRFGIVAGATVEVTTSASASCKLKLPSAFMNLQAGTVPLVLMLKPRAQATVTGKVDIRNAGFSMTLGVDLNGYLGLGGDDDVNARAFASASPTAPTRKDAFDFSISVTAGIQSSVGPGLGNDQAGSMVGITATLDGLRGSVSSSSAPGCLELNAQYYASVVLEAKAWLGRWSLSRSYVVPGLETENPYPGSPWQLPSGCGSSGGAGYRIVDGTMDVSHTWGGGCTSGQGYCTTGVTIAFAENSDARLVVAEAGDWAAPEWNGPAELVAPLRFTGWDLTHDYSVRQTASGCSYQQDDGTVGPVEFGGAFWQTAVAVSPRAGDQLDVELLGQYWTGQNPPWGEWVSFTWASELGAWDTDNSNGFPRVPHRTAWAYSGTCEGSSTSTVNQTVEFLGPGHWWPLPYEARAFEPVVTATRLDGCTPTSCRWRVNGSARYDYRSSHADIGLQGLGSATVTWSFIIERRA